jgi:isoleucyl-tRNA synthetase
MYDFFTLYASVDNWEWDGSLKDPLTDLENPLDKWVVSRLHQLAIEIDTSMEAYDIQKALKPVLEFIDDASNWYVRRSRRRFWKSGNDNDKANAYKTLHYVLAYLAMIMAPFTPFLSDEVYQKLTGEESVHLCYWPEARGIGLELIDNMTKVRDLITQGLAQRAESGLKVRQPLQSVTLTGVGELDNELSDIIKEELNVKEVKIIPIEGKEIELRAEIDTELSDELREEGLIRELVRFIQNSRKEAGLEVEDRISLLIESESPEIEQAVTTYKETIMSETLCSEFGEVPGDAFETTVKVVGLQVKISLSKFLV